MLRTVVVGLALPVMLNAQDTTVATRALLAADQAASMSEAALRSALVPSASVLVPGSDILHGVSAYAPVLARIAPVQGGASAWTPVHAVRSADARFGCTTGVLHLSAADSTKPSTGRYVACWRRTRGGAWRMVALSAAYAPPAVRTLPAVIANAPGSAISPGVPRIAGAGRAGRGARRAGAAAMAGADRAFSRFSADSGGPAGAFSRWIADDGMMLGGRAVPVRGPAQAREAFASFPATGRFEWAPVDSLSAASPDGTLGFTVGEARIAPTPDAVSYSKYLTVWRSERDGTYRWIFDIGSDRPAPRMP